MDQDPWLWNLEQVLEFFRNEAAAYTADRPNSRLPDMSSFLQVLKENDVAGSTLLDGVDGSFLKEDCGIRSLSVRSTIIHCISKLKVRSTTLNIRNGHPLSSMDTTPPAEYPKEPPVNTPIEAPPSAPPPASSVDVRSGEITVVDNQGRKKRKLTLMAPQSRQDTHEAVSQPPSGLTTSPNLTLPPPNSHSAGFLDDSALPVDQLFYGSTLFGQEINQIYSSLEFHEGVVSDVDGGKFEHWQLLPNSCVKPPGQVAYAHGQLRHFFQNAEQKRIKRQSRDAIAILPYIEKLCSNKKGVSATVFRIQSAERAAHTFNVSTDGHTQIDGEPVAVAIRENAAHLDNEVDYTGIAADAAGGEWDFLVQKYREDDEVLPEYGESEQSITSSLDREMANDSDDESSIEEKRQHLTHEEAEDVIEKCIDYYCVRWREKKLPKLELRAWTIWKQTKRSRSERDRLIAGANSTIRLLECRLQKQKDEYLRDIWPSDARNLREVCEIMSVTVEDRQELKWKIDLWRSKKEPKHIVHRAPNPSSKSKSSGARKASFAHGPDDRFSISPAPQHAASEQEESYHTPHDNHAEHEGDNDEDEEMFLDGDVPMPDMANDKTVNDDFILSEDGSAAGSTSVLSRNGLVAPRTPGRESPESDEDSDSPSLPDASSFYQAPERVKTEKLVQTPIKQQTDVIEISSDSETPPSRSKKKAPVLKDISYNPDPLASTASEVQRWPFDELISRQDRLRLLIKLIAEAGRETGKQMRECLRRLRKSNFTERLISALRALMNDNNYLGIDADAQLMTFCAKLYLAYNLLDIELAKNPSALTQVTIPENIVHESQASMFFDRLNSVLQRLDSSLFVPLKASAKIKSTTTSKSNVHSISSDSRSEAEPAERTTPKRRRRKREVKLGERSAHAQHHAFDRQSRFLEVQASSSQEVAPIVPTDAGHSSVRINLLKEDNQDAIFVDSRIAQSIKDHQISGVQFMWREITADGEEGPQGCILAHTMGLGKTMQLVTLLLALNEATQSKNERVRMQLPKSLQIAGEEGRQLRVLIMAPPALLENWRNEISKWGGKKLHNVFTLETGNKKQHLLLLEQWQTSGGIVLIGYDMFRSHINGRKTMKPESASVTTSFHRYLLEEPEIVVADEAHILKNEDSGISKAARRIRSESRIALTGTPMSNDVQEIFSLVSFAAPDYLGDSKWFNNQFAQPIKDGNSTTSTNSEVRQSIKKLAVLHLKIAPKVNRATINVLRGSLTSKVEFVVFLPLSGLQHKTYSKYVNALLGDSRNDKASQVAMFGWLAVLALLTAHPLAFKKKLFAPPPIKLKPRAREITPGTSDSGGATPIADRQVADEEDEAGTAIRTLGFSEQTIQDITSDISDDIDCHLSPKMTVLMEIVKLSKECGDRLLVFSHSLGSLNYIELLFHNSGVRYARIDGSVPPPQRLAIIEQFDNGAQDVLIISTRAGNVGLNIQSANRVVILDFGFNPSYEEQAIGRAYRIGQTKPVFVYRFVVGGTFETHIYEKQMFKLSLTSRVVDKKSTKRTAQAVTREWLHEPREVAQGNVSSVMKDECVLDRILDRQIQLSNSNPDQPALIRHLDTMETLTEEVLDIPLNDEEKAEVNKEYLEGLKPRRRRKVAPTNFYPPPPSTAPARGPERPAMSRTFATPGTQPVRHVPTFTPPRGPPPQLIQRDQDAVSLTPFAIPPLTDHEDPGRRALTTLDSSNDPIQAMPHGLPDVPPSTAPSRPRQPFTAGGSSDVFTQSTQQNQT